MFLYAEEVVQESKPDSPGFLSRLIALIVLVLSFFYRWQLFIFGIIVYALFGENSYLGDFGELCMLFGFTMLVLKSLVNQFLA
jgi:hypothetical protein